MDFVNCGEVESVQENDPEEDLGFSNNRRLLRKQSARTKRLCAKEERNATIKRVSLILQKSEEEHSTEEKDLLNEYSDIVKEVKSRWKKRDEAKRRLEEYEEPYEEMHKKCIILAQAIAQSQHLVVYTGAGISTAARIPDYRGTNGIWTRLQQGKDIGNHDLSLAEPTYTHMALSELYKRNKLKYVVSQNCDGLHLRSGLPRTAVSEVHGNMYIEVCKNCKPSREYWRLFDVTENTARYSHKTMRKCYHCNGCLVDTIVHFGERGSLQWPLNWSGASKNAKKATTILCLGSSLKVLKKYPWLWQMHKPVKRRPNLYIVNLQWTPKDDCANVKINGKCDIVMKIVMDLLGIQVPEYDRMKDPIYAHGTVLCDQELHTTTQPFLKDVTKKEQEEIDEKNEAIKSEIESQSNYNNCEIQAQSNYKNCERENDGSNAQFEYKTAKKTCFINGTKEIEGGEGVKSQFYKEIDEKTKDDVKNGIKIESNFAEYKEMEEGKKINVNNMKVVTKENKEKCHEDGIRIWKNGLKDEDMDMKKNGLYKRNITIKEEITEKTEDGLNVEDDYGMKHSLFVNQEEDEATAKTEIKENRVENLTNLICKQEENDSIKNQVNTQRNGIKNPEDVIKRQLDHDGIKIINSGDVDLTMKMDVRKNEDAKIVTNEIEEVGSTEQCNSYNRKEETQNAQTNKIMNNRIKQNEEEIKDHTLNLNRYNIKGETENVQTFKTMNNRIKEDEEEHNLKIVHHGKEFQRSTRIENNHNLNKCSTDFGYKNGEDNKRTQFEFPDCKNELGTNIHLQSEMKNKHNLQAVTHFDHNHLQTQSHNEKKHNLQVVTQFDHNHQQTQSDHEKKHDFQAVAQFDHNHHQTQFDHGRKHNLQAVKAHFDHNHHQTEPDHESKHNLKAEIQFDHDGKHDLNAVTQFDNENKNNLKAVTQFDHESKHNLREVTQFDHKHHQTQSDHERKHHTQTPMKSYWENKHYFQTLSKSDCDNKPNLKMVSLDYVKSKSGRSNREERRQFKMRKRAQLDYENRFSGGAQPDGGNKHNLKIITPQIKNCDITTLESNIYSINNDDLGLNLALPRKSAFSIDDILNHEKRSLSYQEKHNLNCQTLLNTYYHISSALYRDFHYPFQTSLLYSGLHSIINPLPLINAEHNYSVVKNESDKKSCDDSGNKYFTEREYSEVKAEAIPIQEPSCSYCHENYASFMCLFYTKYEPVFLKQQFRFSKVEKTEKPFCCVCCDYTTDEEEEDEEMAVEEEKDPSSPSPSPDKICKIQEEGVVGGGGEQKVKIQPGWFGKGYRKNRKYKKRIAAY